MSQELEIKINRMPAITWNWLRLNDASVRFAQGGTDAGPSVEPAEGVTVSEDASAVSGMEAGAGKAFNEIAENAPWTVYTKAAGDRSEQALRMKFNYEDGQNGLNRVGLVAEPGSVMTVVMDYASKSAAGGCAGVQTKALVRENALLRLVQVHRMGEGFTLVNDLGVVCEKKARVEIIHVIFSGKETDIGCRVTLKGDDSSYRNDIGYLAAKDHRIDMNYAIPQLGRRTKSEIAASGVLRDSASKIFRGTIDFQRGAAGSTGDETENVLLMDDGVVNQSVPVILCNEEDVEGNHGATIGKLSDDLLFYLESRGIPFDDIYEMMAQARLESVFRKIPDEKTVDELAAFSENREKS